MFNLLYPILNETTTRQDILYPQIFISLLTSWFLRVFLQLTNSVLNRNLSDSF